LFVFSTKNLLDLYEEGKIIVPTHYEYGIESFPRALKMLFNGGHTGKLMVKI
jgi:NADPH-dependent curcumin reductase CurA